MIKKSFTVLFFLLIILSYGNNFEQWQYSKLFPLDSTCNIYNVRGNVIAFLKLNAPEYFTQAKENGADIRIVNPVDSSELDFSIHSWSPELQSVEIYVKLDKKIINDILMFWGNPYAEAKTISSDAFGIPTSEKPEKMEKIR